MPTTILYGFDSPRRALLPQSLVYVVFVIIVIVVVFNNLFGFSICICMAKISFFFSSVACFILNKCKLN